MTVEAPVTILAQTMTDLGQLGAAMTAVALSHRKVVRIVVASWPQVAGWLEQIDGGTPEQIDERAEVIRRLRSDVEPDALRLYGVPVEVEPR